jgi:hypothetical protein
MKPSRESRILLEVKAETPVFRTAFNVPGHLARVLVTFRTASHV